MRTNKLKTILVDLDDVLNTFNSASTGWVKLYNDKYGDKHIEKYGTLLQTEHIVDWDLHKFTLPGVDVFKEFIYKKHIFKKNNFFRSVGIQPYAQEVTRELSNYFDIYVVSASHFTTVPDKAEWLLEYFPHIPVKQFIPCYNKYMIRGDILIDDKFDNLINFDGKRVLFDRPWNRQYQSEELLKSHNIEVMNGWVNWVEGIKGNVR